MSYVWHPNFPKRTLDAEACAAVIGDMVNGGKPLDYDALIRKARSPKSPLHDGFTWDDTEAAGQWRRHEARRLVQFLYVTDDAGELHHRAFLSIQAIESEDDEQSQARIWVRTDAAIENRQLREAVLRTALGELDALRRKYGHLKELAAVFDAAEKVKSGR